jgi:glycosyltransferase involved in cell wall biosynthesis
MMPVFNAGPYLDPAIESLCAQTFADWELIAVDDGSTDESPATLQRWSRRDNRICVFRQDQNRGIPATRNFGLSKMRGQFFAFLNHDDVALPTRLAEQLAFFESNSEIQFLGTAIENVDERGTSLGTIVMPETELEIRWMALFDCPIRHSALMGRAGAFAGLRYDESMPINSDYDFLSRAIQKVRAANLSRVLVQYRKHPRNTSRLRHDEFVANGAHISRAAIARELPEFAIEESDIIEIRATLLNYRKTGSRRVVPEMKRAIELYLDLFQAFAEKYRSHPLMTKLRDKVNASSVAMT